MRFIVCDTHEEIARLGADMIEEVMKNKKDSGKRVTGWQRNIPSS